MKTNNIALTALAFGIAAFLFACASTEAGTLLYNLMIASLALCGWFLIMAALAVKGKAWANAIGLWLYKTKLRFQIKTELYKHRRELKRHKTKTP